MVSINKCILLFFLTVINNHLITKTNANLVQNFDDGNCLMQQGAIGPTFKRTGNCKFLHIAYINISEPSKQLFESIAVGLESLRIYKVIVDEVYLPQNVTYFSVVGTPEWKTLITIDEHTIYKVQRILLDELPQILSNVNLLQELKVFEAIRIYGQCINLTELNQMGQLENIVINECTGVTVSNFLQLPFLRSLTIHNSALTFSNDLTCELPKLNSLSFLNNSLLVIPDCFYTLTNLTDFSVSGNKLRHVDLNAFAQLHQLEVLSLTDNQIVEIMTAHQVKLLRLRKLFLGGNRLSELDVTSWLMPALECLTVDGNQLKQVAGLPELISDRIRHIRMDENVWNCEWLSVTVQKIPGVKMFNNGSCFAVQENGW